MARHPSLATAWAVLLAAIVSAVACGCSSTPNPPPEIPFTALDARRDGTLLHVRYLGTQGLLYSETELPPRFAPSGDPSVGAFPVYVVEPIATGREPPSGRRNGRRVAVLGPEVYGAVLQEAIGGLVPDEPYRAVLLEMRGENAAVFRDAEGRLETWIGGPPEGVETVSTVVLEEALGPVPASIRAHLEENGVEAHEVLLNTGEADRNPWPFVYVDLDSAAAAFVLVRSPGEPAPGPDPRFTVLTGPAANVVASHTVGLLRRPVSSIARLLLMVTDAVRDTAAPNWTIGLDDRPVPPLREQPPMDLAEWESTLDRMTGRSSAPGTVTPLIDGEAFFERLGKALRGARESIQMRMYIFDDDDVALRVAKLLRARAAAGVDVRVLIDDLGSVAAAGSQPAGLPAGHEPPPSIHRYLEKGSDVDVRASLNPFGESDHTKSVIIDDEIAFVGGMNIGREYRYEWHDAMFELRGPVIERLADDFDAAWAGAGWLGDLGELFQMALPGRTARSEGAYPVRVLYTSATASEIRNAQLAAIDRARSYVYLHHAYLSDDAILYALVMARRRGVDVRVVIALHSDRGAIARNSVLAANLLYRNGVRVFIYPGMSHMKAVAADGWVCVGSANANHLSLRYNRETNIATSAPEAVEPILETLFEADFRAAPEMRRQFPVKWHDYLWEMIGDLAF